MKKIFLFLLVLISLKGLCQYPVNTPIGNASQLQYQNGSYGARLGYVFKDSFGDTTAANVSFVKNVPGQVIRVGDTLWMRNMAVTRWIKVGSGSSVDLSGYLTKADSTSYATFLRLYKVRDSLAAAYTAAIALTLKYSDTAAMKLQRDSDTTLWDATKTDLANAIAGISGNYIKTAGSSTITSNITVNGFAFDYIENLAYKEINSDDGNGNTAQLAMSGSHNMFTNSGSSKNGGIDIFSPNNATTRLVKIYSSNSGAGVLSSNSSWIDINPDSISFNLMNTTGKLYVTNLISAVAANDSMLVWNPTTKSVGIKSIPGTGSGSPNSNIGSGYRWAVPWTNNIKTAFAGNGILIDSSSNANSLTFTVDSSIYSTKAYAQSLVDALGTPTLQQVTNEGNTTTDGIYTDSNVGFAVLESLPSGSVKAAIGKVSDIGHLILSNAATYSSTIKPQAALGGFRTNYLPNTGNTTDTIATLYDLRAAGVGGGGSYTDADVEDYLETYTGDVTATGTVFSIGASKVTNSMLAGSIAASKLVGTDITTVGTIGTGTWQGSSISTTYTDAKLTAVTTTDNNLTVASGTTAPVVTTKKAVQSLTDGSTITMDAASGFNATVTIASTGRTLTISNPQAGQYYTVKIVQDATGSRTITTWPTGTKWIGGAAPTLSTAANSIDIVTFFYDGTNYFGTYGKAYN